MYIGISLPNSRASSSNYKVCDRHKEATVPEGGVQLTPTRWICAKCWFSMRPQTKRKL
jgi:hypothetical protein